MYESNNRPFFDLYSQKHRYYRAPVLLEVYKNGFIQKLINEIEQKLRLNVKIFFFFVVIYKIYQNRNHVIDVSSNNLRGGGGEGGESEYPQHLPPPTNIHHGIHLLTAGVYVLYVFFFFFTICVVKIKSFIQFVRTTNTIKYCNR